MEILGPKLQSPNTGNIWSHCKLINAWTFILVQIYDMMKVTRDSLDNELQEGTGDTMLKQVQIPNELIPFVL